MNRKRTTRPLSHVVRTSNKLIEGLRSLNIIIFKTLPAELKKHIPNLFFEIQPHRYGPYFSNDDALEFKASNQLDRTEKDPGNY